MSKDYRLISLNVWGGRLFDSLMTFLEREQKNTDIFCFQEVHWCETGQTEIKHDGLGIVVRANLYQELTTLLTDFVGYYAPAVHNVWQEKGAMYGLAIFVRKGIAAKEKTAFIYRDEIVDMIAQGIESTLASVPRIIQSVRLTEGVEVAHFHGLWKRNIGKGDLPERLSQSDRVNAFLENSQSHVLCGDFNLEPSTESLAKLKQGRRDLIAEHGVTSTRSSHYHKEGKFADYLLTTSSLGVHHFEVMQDEVSDHLPLLLEFTC